VQADERLCDEAHGGKRSAKRATDETAGVPEQDAADVPVVGHLPALKRKAGERGCAGPRVGGQGQTLQTRGAPCVMQSDQL
jgi:hypothetical protein